MTPVLLSQHDLTRAFFQALGEELPQLVGALQGHVHPTNSSARESVSSATTALSSSVCYKPRASSGITAVLSFFFSITVLLVIPPSLRHHCLVPAVP